MIRVIRLSGEVIFLNYFQIEYMETIPETKIRMMDGNYYLVKDTVESILEQVAGFIHSCIIFDHKA